MAAATTTSWPLGLERIRRSLRSSPWRVDEARCDAVDDGPPTCHEAVLAALLQRLEALWTHQPAAPPSDGDEAWTERVERRQLDASVGVLLARAAMLDPRSRPRQLDRADDMATGHVGSFAWWCRAYLEAWEDDYPLGEQLRDDEVDAFLGAARLTLDDLDDALLAALVRAFPAIAP